MEELLDQLIDKLAVIEDKACDEDDEVIINACREMYTIIDKLRGKS